MDDVYARSAESRACRFEAWEVVLDRIELDVIRGERALDAGLGPDRLDDWHVPDDYGPIPAALRSRAEEILSRQQQLLARIAERLGTTAAHQAIIDHVGRASTRASHQAIYVDVTA